MNLFVRRKEYTFLDRYDVLDDTSRLVITADGKLTRFRGHLTMRDRAGKMMFSIHKQPVPFFANYSIRDRDFEFANMKQRFSLFPTFNIAGEAGIYTIKGNLRAHDFEILHDGVAYGKIHRRLLKWGDCYVLAFSNTEDVPLFCALTIALDNAMYHNI